MYCVLYTVTLCCLARRLWISPRVVHGFLYLVHNILVHVNIKCYGEYWHFLAYNNGAYIYHSWSRYNWLFRSLSMFSKPDIDMYCTYKPLHTAVIGSVFMPRFRLYLWHNWGHIFCTYSLHLSCVKLISTTRLLSGVWSSMASVRVSATFFF